MAIHPINAEHRNTPVESSVTSLSNTQLIQKLLNPELRALIEQYANQPLLLEKLLLQKNSEALITLKLSPVALGNSQSSSSSPLRSEIIQLKLPNQSNLPVDIKELIELLKSANKISFSIESNQQIVIKISNSVQKPQSERVTPIIQINFTKIELSPKGELILSHPLPIKQNQAVTNTPLSNLVPTGTVKTGAVQTLDLNKNLGVIASSLISQSSKPSNKLSTDFVQIESINRQLKDSVSKVSNDSNIINNFIKQVESLGFQKLTLQKQGTQKNVVLDVKTIEFAKTSATDFIQNSNKINSKIQKLINAITKPIALERLTQTDTTENTKNLVSRLIKSGNLFENALKKRVVKNDLVSLNTSPLNTSPNTSSKIPSDNKLIFNQINSQLEKLLVEIIRYSEKPVSVSRIERIEKSLVAQVKDFTPLEKHQLESNKKIVIQKIQAQQEQLQNVIQLSKSLQGVIKSSLLQVEQNQLHSLKSEQFNLQQFLVDLPIKQNGMIDSFEMRFENPSKSNNFVKKILESRS